LKLCGGSGCYKDAGVLVDWTKVPSADVVVVPEKGVNVVVDDREWDVNGPAATAY